VGEKKTRGEGADPREPIIFRRDCLLCAWSKGRTVVRGRPRPGSQKSRTAAPDVSLRSRRARAARGAALGVGAATAMAPRRTTRVAIACLLFLATASSLATVARGDDAASASDADDEAGTRASSSSSSSSSDARTTRDLRREGLSQRAKLERAFPHAFTRPGGDSGPVYAAARGRLGSIGARGEREKTFEQWVRSPPPREDAAENDENHPHVGPVEIRAVWGRGRGVVTTRNVTKGETLVAIPLEKCLSTFSARKSAIGEALKTITSREVTIDAVIALHLLHELYVQREKSEWWPWVSILPRDVETPLLWTPRELAQLEGSNLIGFRDAVLKGWTTQRDALFPKLTQKFPSLFPEEHFRTERWAWAMAIVWSRAADVPVPRPEAIFPSGDDKSRELRVIVPLFDMINHGYDHAPVTPGGVKGGGGEGREKGGVGVDDSPALIPSWDPSRRMVAIRAGVPFPGPNYEVRFNYGAKPSQHVLLQYGFVPMNNPDESVEVAMHAGSRDKLKSLKSELLRTHELSPRERNFQFYPRRLDADLLAATRVQMMSELEINSAAAISAAVAGAPVSDRNEAKTRAMLLKAAHDMLRRYPTTLWEDKKIVQEHADANPVDADEASEREKKDAEEETTTTTTGDDDDEAAHPTLSKRVKLGIMMRIQEKSTLLAAARLVAARIPDDAGEGEDVCEERYPQRELRACLDRLSGVAFDRFERPPEEEEEEEEADDDDDAEDGEEPSSRKDEL